MDGGHLLRARPHEPLAGLGAVAVTTEQLKVAEVVARTIQVIDLDARRPTRPTGLVVPRDHDGPDFLGDSSSCALIATGRQECDLGPDGLAISGSPSRWSAARRRRYLMAAAT